MSLNHLNRHARQLIMAKGLIAADVDKTILAQGSEEERQQFVRKMAPELVNAASLGTNLAFLTGNSMHELSSRFLRWLIEYLCYTENLELLERFHFFCNSGGVYAHFSLQDEMLTHHSANLQADKIFSSVIEEINGDGKLAIRARFIDSSYIERCRIPEADVVRIQRILEAVATQYTRDLQTKQEIYEKKYDLKHFMQDGLPIKPQPDLRIVRYGSQKTEDATVQITLKPLLSFRYAHHPVKMFNKDLRRQYTRAIQAKLDEQGLEHYLARPGGRSSIDVTLAKLDKAYALEFLIDQLNLQGQGRKGQQFGSNTIYFGDEVIVGGGNDYPVTRIPGLLVFAVNSDKDLIPFLSHIFVPSTILAGPDAVIEVLKNFNMRAQQLLNEYIHSQNDQMQPDYKTAIEVLKKEIFISRVEGKLSDLKQADYLSAENLQTLHAFVTLMMRRDPAARRWLSILVKELDAIMMELATAKARPHLALGASYPKQ